MKFKPVAVISLVLVLLALPLLAACDGDNGTKKTIDTDGTTDVTITIGAFALTEREISLAIIAAFLTIVGYSLNDTIIVFDRIRENLRRFRRQSFEEVMNKSINETLSRTVLTSTTTLIVVLALFILGGGVIHDFELRIMIGVIVGTYSSIFVASPIILVWEERFAKRGKSTALPSAAK